VVKVMDCTILEGRRTDARQGQLWAQGRTEPGQIVTYCDGIIKKSNHQAKSDGWSWAADVAPWPIDWEDEPRFYRFAGFVEATALRLGIKVKWGGDFKRGGKPWPDTPHWELIQ